MTTSDRSLDCIGIPFHDVICSHSKLHLKPPKKNAPHILSHNIPKQAGISNFLVQLSSDILRYGVVYGGAERRTSASRLDRTCSDGDFRLHHHEEDGIRFGGRGMGRRRRVGGQGQRRRGAHSFVGHHEYQLQHVHKSATSDPDVASAVTVWSRDQFCSTRPGLPILEESNRR